MTSHSITGMVPVFGIRSYDEAVAYYVDWLGFNLDWEWREAPGQPVIMHITRDGVSLMLNESVEVPSVSWLTLKVTDVHAFAAEWNAKRSNSVKVAGDPPYDIPTIFLKDTFGNRLDFEQLFGVKEKEFRERRASDMRDYVRQRLSGGYPCPTPDEVVEAVGRSPILAMAILGEFPEYE
jgi:hypothetical protein